MFPGPLVLHMTTLRGGTRVNPEFKDLAKKQPLLSRIPNPKEARKESMRKARRTYREGIAFEKEGKYVAAMDKYLESMRALTGAARTHYGEGLLKRKFAARVLENMRDTRTSRVVMGVFSRAENEERRQALSKNSEFDSVKKELDAVLKKLKNPGHLTSLEL
jgi:hypothetical protein